MSARDQGLIAHVIIAASKNDGCRYTQDLGLSRYSTIILTPTTGIEPLAGNRVRDIHVSLPAQVNPNTEVLVEAATALLVPQTEYEG